MTFLELVNKVLQKLREDEASSLTADYTRLVAGFVNEAKEDIEDMGPWYPLRTTVNATLTQDNDTLSLEDATNERSYLLFTKNLPLAFVVTADEEHRLQVVEKGEIDALNALDPDAQHDVPYAVAFTSDNDGLTATFFPAPDAAYDVRFVFVVPQEDLAEASDEVSIPSAPVWRLALFYALEERGEDFAGPAARAEVRAKNAISNAMLNDFLRDDLTFEAV